MARLRNVPQAPTQPGEVWVLTSTWPGPFSAEARASYERCRLSGLSTGRSLVIGCIASFKQGWIFRRTLAAHTSLSVRTVQRAITQAKSLGLLGTARAKKTEVPPGLNKPIACGWSHRWIVGWGLAVDQARAAVQKALEKRLHGEKVLRYPNGTMRRKPLRLTADELEAELQRLELRQCGDSSTTASVHGKPP